MYKIIQWNTIWNQNMETSIGQHRGGSINDSRAIKWNTCSQYKGQQRAKWGDDNNKIYITHYLPGTFHILIHSFLTIIPENWGMEKQQLAQTQPLSASARIPIHTCLAEFVLLGITSH